MKVSRLSGTESVVGQRGKFEFYALLNRKPMKIFENTRWVFVLWESVTGNNCVLESLQKRAVNVIYAGIEYRAALTIAVVDTLRSRREELTRRFINRHVLDKTSCLHYLLPQRETRTLLQDFGKLEHFRRKQTDFITLLSHTLLEISCSSSCLHYSILY